MAKTLIPIRMVINLNKDGSFKDGILQYKIDLDGVVNDKFYSVGIDKGINLETVATTVSEALDHTVQAENINSAVLVSKPILKSESVKI